MKFVTMGAPTNTQLDQHIIDTVQHALAATETPGAAVTLLLNGESLVTAGVGHVDLARTIVLDAHAQFYIYSVTKPLLATLILHLVEDRRIKLDAPVQLYLTDLALDRPVTIRQLLNHTGGIPDYGALPVYQAALRADPTHPWTDDDFLFHTLPNGFAFMPGQGWGYSNIGFLLLRQVVEAVTGTSFRTAFHQQIRVPLGLKHTFIAQTLNDARSLTPGYSTFFHGDSLVQDVRAYYWVTCHAYSLFPKLDVSWLYASLRV